MSHDGSTGTGLLSNHRASQPHDHRDLRPFCCRCPQPCLSAWPLTGQGYRHEGDLGIPGRDAFQAPSAAPEHHLYGVVAGSKPYLDHILLRDYLRQRPDEVRRYSALKVALAQRFHADGEGRQEYSTAKGALVEELVAKSYAARAAGEP
ncbi:GrpB family protein [Streptomyces sp. NPDC007164]|uniref:GrpB family protein n=1 Tax=Streptomyces sp. NPDC007164 TaxID=3156918 RepID=UPI0033E0EAFE